MLGVTGGIAAYKAVEVCRRLMDANAHVVPVLTESALQMVGATTFTALASEPAKTSLWDDSRGPILHTKLGSTADAIVICPATARVISDLRAGRSCDLLTATVLASRASVILAPAMHTEMWEQPSVQENIRVLVERQVNVLWPVEGRLAGGDVGAGRMSDPSAIVAAVESAIAATNSSDACIISSDVWANRVNTPTNRVDISVDRVGRVSASTKGDSTNRFANRKVLVTAGGTCEPIDAVRFIGNRSSGKQGCAIATEFAARGADTLLVATRRAMAHAPHGVKVIAADTAADMAIAVKSEAPSMDVVVMAAAVADFRPVKPSKVKHKKCSGVLTVKLEPTEDILAGLNEAKPQGQVLVGFAAETDDMEQNARRKLAEKSLQVVVANDVSQERIGFDSDHNEVIIFTSDGQRRLIPFTNKRAVARILVDVVSDFLP